MHPLPYHRHDPADRDEAIHRVRRTTRWLIAGSLLGTGVLVGVAAHELPGKSTSAATSGSTGSTGTGASSGSSSSSGSSTSSGGSSGSGTNSSGLGSSGSGGSTVTPPTSSPTVTPRIHASSGGS